MEKMIFDIKNHSVKQIIGTTPFKYEHALQEYIYYRPGILALSSELKDVKILYDEKSQNQGRYDLVVSYNDDEMLVVAELKKDVIDCNAYKQLMKYLTSNESESTVEADKYEYGLLVGTSIEPAVVEKIEKGNNIYAIVLSRFNDNENEYVHTTVYGPKDKFQKDYTKYTLTNLQGDSIQGLGKGRLAYEVVKSYIEANQGKNLDDVKNEFNDVFNKGKITIVIQKSIVDNEPKLKVRYFSEPVICNGEEVLITNQWGVGNIDGMIKKAEKIGMVIEEKNKY